MSAEQVRKTYRVQASFYVEAGSEKEAEKLVNDELASRPVQKLIGDTVGDPDVHTGETTEWNMDD